MATRNTIKGVGGKRINEQTNNMLELTQAQEEKLCNIAFPMCICRLTLAWISWKNSTTNPWGVLIILSALPSLTLGPYLIPTAHFCCPVSTGHSRRSSPTAFSQFLFPTPLAFPYLLPVTPRSRVQTLCLVSRQNRQKDRLLGGPPT